MSGYGGEPTGLKRPNWGIVVVGFIVVLLVLSILPSAGLLIMGFLIIFYGCTYGSESGTTARTTEGGTGID